MHTDLLRALQLCQVHLNSLRSLQLYQEDIGPVDAGNT
jgi:hypothetical protein